MGGFHITPFDDDLIVLPATEKCEPCQQQKPVEQIDLLFITPPNSDKTNLVYICTECIKSLTEKGYTLKSIGTTSTISTRWRDDDLLPTFGNGGG